MTRVRAQSVRLSLLREVVATATRASHPPRFKCRRFKRQRWLIASARGSIEKFIIPLVEIVATWDDNCRKGKIAALSVSVKSSPREVSIKQRNCVGTKDVAFHARVRVSVNVRQRSMKFHVSDLGCEASVLCFRRV